MKLPGIEYLNPNNFLTFVENGIYGLDKKKLSEWIKKIENNKIVNFVSIGTINCWKLGDELCKYFFMANKFQNGIFIVSARNIKEELDYFKENIKSRLNNENNDNNNNNQILILFKLAKIDEEDDNFNELKKFLAENGANIIICCQEKKPIEIKNEEVVGV